jgi:hypothetical protein
MSFGVMNKSPQQNRKFRNLFTEIGILMYSCSKKRYEDPLQGLEIDYGFQGPMMHELVGRYQSFGRIYCPNLQG